MNETDEKPMIWADPEASFGDLRAAALSAGLKADGTKDELRIKLQKNYAQQNQSQDTPADGDQPVYNGPADEPAAFGQGDNTVQIQPDVNVQPAPLPVPAQPAVATVPPEITAKMAELQRQIESMKITIQQVTTRESQPIQQGDLTNTIGVEEVKEPRRYYAPQGLNLRIAMKSRYTKEVEGKAVTVAGHMIEFRDGLYTTKNKQEIEYLEAQGRYQGAHTMFGRVYYLMTQKMSLSDLKSLQKSNAEKDSEIARLQAELNKYAGLAQGQQSDPNANRLAKQAAGRDGLPGAGSDGAKF